MVGAQAAPAAAAIPFVVVLDAGHGGSPDNSRPDLQFDPGSIGANGVAEKQLTLEVARRVRKLLQDAGIRVVMTRDSDRFVSIAQRTTIANNSGANLFVSIHFNYFQDPSVGGTQVFFPNNASASFAGAMSKALAQKLTGFGVGSNGTMLKDDLWTQTRMPSVTVESAYLTNPRELQLLGQPAFLDAIASGVTVAIRAQAATAAAPRPANVLDSASEAISSPVRSLRIAGPSMPSFAPAVLVVGILVLAIFFRRSLRPVVVPAAAITILLVDRARRQDPAWRNRRGVRRRRSRAPFWSGDRA